MARTPQYEGTPHVDDDTDQLPPPGGEMLVEIRRIGPKFATAALEQRNTLNRNVVDNAVNDYAQQMKKGKWRLTPQGIAFDDKGVLIDGQHRLFAVIESGMTIQTLCTWNAPPEAREVIDTGRRRAVGDQMKMLLDGVDSGRAWSASYMVVRDLNRGLFHDSSKLGRIFHFDEAKALHTKLRSRMEQLQQLATPAGIRKISAKPVGAILWAMTGPRVSVVDHVLPFIVGIAKGEHLKQGDPAYYMREELFNGLASNRASAEGIERKVLVTLVCLRAQVLGKSVFKVKPGDYGPESKAREELFTFFKTLPGSVKVRKS